MLCWPEMGDLSGAKRWSGVIKIKIMIPNRRVRVEIQPATTERITLCQCEGGLTLLEKEPNFPAAIGGHSSMVEPQIVVLDVAGSSPVGHPILRWSAAVAKDAAPKHPMRRRAQVHPWSKALRLRLGTP